MGSGKTNVGKQLAKHLKWSWVDVDEEIVRQAGKSIPEIFANEGEAYFRELERQCLLELLPSENQVVSCGGGIVTRPDNLRDLVAQPRSVCLRVSPETVFRRVGNDPRRPLLQGADPLGKIRELMQQRAPYYQEFPHQIDVDKLKTKEVVRKIIDELGLRPL